MKKAILFLSALLSVVLMAINVYAAESEPFYYKIMNKDGITYTTAETGGDITLPEGMGSFYVTDDYIYYVYFAGDESTNGLYRCNKDLSHMTFLLKYSIGKTLFYENSIYFVVYSSSPKNQSIYSFNTESGELTKHITYKGLINLFTINDGYMYFTVSEDRTGTSRVSEKFYKQSIYDTNDKKLMYLTQREGLLDCVLTSDEIYIDTAYTLKILDKNSGRILAAVDKGSEVSLIAGKKDNKVYFYTYSGSLFTINNNYEYELLSTNDFLAEINNTMISDYVSDDHMYFYSYDYENFDEILYEYNVNDNTFVKLN